MNKKTYTIAEVGINHNGSVDQAIKMCRKAKAAGFDAVKFQMRTVDLVYSKEELEKKRETPFGKTNGDYKRGVEFSVEDYKLIDEECRKWLDMEWSASVWDIQSLDRLMQFDPRWVKIASPSITDLELLKVVRDTGKEVFLSTGMSTIEEVDKAVGVFKDQPLTIMHCVSTYPTEVKDLNLKVIETLTHKYPYATIGYSGHERELETTVAAVALGAKVVERHVTISRSLWGSDQKASLTFQECEDLIKRIRNVDLAMGDGIKRLLPEEEPIKAKLRRQVVNSVNRESQRTD